MDPKQEALETALTRWAKRGREHAQSRDPLVRAAVDAGISKQRVHVLTGIARTTIDSILSSDGERPMDALDVACPKCGSGEGERCRSLTTNRSTDTHESRRTMLYRAQARHRRTEGDPR